MEGISLLFQGVSFSVCHVRFSHQVTSSGGHKGFTKDGVTEDGRSMTFCKEWLKCVKSISFPNETYAYFSIPGYFSWWTSMKLWRHPSWSTQLFQDLETDLTSLESLVASGLRLGGYGPTKLEIQVLVCFVCYPCIFASVFRGFKT